MDYEPILVTKRRIGQAIFISCICLVIVGLSVFSVYKGFTTAEYIQLNQVCAGLVFFLLGGFLFYSVKRMVSYRLYEDRLEVISVAGNMTKTIWLNTITSWCETEIKNNSKMLALYMGDERYTISSRGMGADYTILKDKVTGGKQQMPWQANAALQMRIAYGMLLAGICCFAFSYSKYQVRNTEVHAQDVTIIRGVILNPVAVSRTGGRSSRDYIRIILSSYPEFQFTIDYSAYRATRHSDYVNDVQRADSLYLDILTEDYEKKLTKEKPLSFFDKTIDYRRIDVYGLRDAHHEYLTEDGYNRAVKGDMRFVGFAVYGLFAFVFAVVMIVKMNKQKVGE